MTQYKILNYIFIKIKLTTLFKRNFRETSDPPKSRYDQKLINEYLQSFTYSGLDHESDANFVIVAKFLPKDNHPNYDQIMDNLWEFYQEQIESKKTTKFNIFFVSGLSKLNNLPKVKFYMMMF